VAGAHRAAVDALEMAIFFPQNGAPASRRCPKDKRSFWDENTSTSSPSKTRLASLLDQRARLNSRW
jgi:hypothetical protein